MEYNRTELLLGHDEYAKIQSIRVIIFGIGGVGSWCAECLVRSGVTNLTIVDFDSVATSNINRQIPATALTVGLPKVDVMRQRLLDINPNANINAINRRFSAENAGEWQLSRYDYIIDAIDSVPDKANLIIESCIARPAILFSSMGAALKTDPLKISVAEFWQVQGCPLAAALRRRFKRSALFPARKFKCVFSPELHRNAINPSDDPNQIPNGSLAHITGVFGLNLAALVIRHAAGQKIESRRG